MSPLVSDHPFHKDLLCSRGIAFNLCPENHWRVVILKDVISGPFNYAEHNDPLKNFIEYFWGNDQPG